MNCTSGLRPWLMNASKRSGEERGTFRRKDDDCRERIRELDEKAILSSWLARERMGTVEVV